MVVEIEINGVSESFAESNSISLEKSKEVEPETKENAAAAAPVFEAPLAKLQEINVTDYIRKSLDKVATSEGFKNYELLFDHGSSIGDGFIGIMLKVSIKEKDSDKFLSVLAKIPPANKLRREQMKIMKVFEREVFVYNVMLPEFVEFQKERRIHQSMTFNNFPKIYFAEYDEELDDGIIIMEDLRDRDFKMWSKFEPVNLEHTKLLMIALGRLHALSFGMKAKKPELFEKYKQLSDYFTENLEDLGFKNFIESTVAKAAESLEEGDTRRRAKIAKLQENLVNLLQECVDPEQAEPFNVVNHGDCWINNFLYHYKRGRPDDIVLIDWQISRYCSPVIDLVYFFFICTDHHLRAKHFDELLSLYHHSLKELLDHLGGDTMTQFPFTALLRHLKKFAKFGVVMSAMIMPMIQTKNEELLDMDYMTEQMQNQDPAVMEEMMKQYMEKSSGYNASTIRMRGVIHDAVKYGYL